MLPDEHNPRTPPPSVDNRLSVRGTYDGDTIDELWDRIIGLAECGLTEGWPTPARDLGVLILHYHRLQCEGWPTPSAHVQPIPETVDVPVTGELL